jgi:hypothetical protein
LSEYGGTHKIVQILSRDNVDKKTTDITLSVLGNLCMDEDARKLVNWEQTKLKPQALVTCTTRKKFLLSLSEQFSLFLGGR